MWLCECPKASVLQHHSKVNEAFEKKDQLHILNISEVIDSEKCAYLTAQKLLFKNTLPESTSWWVLNTAEITMAELLSSISINIRHIEFENVSISQMWNPMTVS